MLTLDDDETDLALMALRHTADQACAQSTNGSLQSGGAAKACVDGFCVPRLRALIERIQQYKQDQENGDA
jgi:hypothetical protein